MSRVNARRVLAALAAAGETGLLSGEVAVALGAADGSFEARQQRLRNSNEVLRRQREQGLARRSACKERGVSTYHGAPSYRWFITDAGRAVLEAPLRPTVREQAAARPQQRQAARARDIQLI